jgi:hypothetical protein
VSSFIHTPLFTVKDFYKERNLTCRKNLGRAQKKMVEYTKKLALEEGKRTIGLPYQTTNPFLRLHSRGINGNA